MCKATSINIKNRKIHMKYIAITLLCLISSIQAAEQSLHAIKVVFSHGADYNSTLWQQLQQDLSAQVQRNETNKESDTSAEDFMQKFDEEMQIITRMYNLTVSEPSVDVSISTYEAAVSEYDDVNENKSFAFAQDLIVDEQDGSLQYLVLFEPQDVASQEKVATLLEDILSDDVETSLGRLADMLPVTFSEYSGECGTVIHIS
jgi:hypothetical protein